MKENEKYRKEIEKLKNRYGRPARKVLSEEHKKRLKEGLWKLSIVALMIGLIFMGIKGHTWAIIAVLIIGAIPLIILKIDEWWLNPEEYPEEMFDKDALWHFSENYSYSYTYSPPEED